MFVLYYNYMKINHSKHITIWSDLNIFEWIILPQYTARFIHAMYSYVYCIEADLYCLDFIFNSPKFSCGLILILSDLNSQNYHKNCEELIIINVIYLRM